jgi:hypothetical protein
MPTIATMPTYLDTAKIQKLNRLILSRPALRNLGVDVGDKVEVFFDEASRCLLIKPLQSHPSRVAVDGDASPSKRIRRKS